jgi:hypothetical protein
VAAVGETLVRLTEWLWAKQLEPISIELGGESLEAVFLRLTSESGEPVLSADGASGNAGKPGDPA